MATWANFKVIYEHDGVFTHTEERDGGQDSLTSGRLKVIEKNAEVMVELRPEEDDGSTRRFEAQLSGEAEWDLLNAVHYRRHPGAGSSQQGLCFSLSDLVSIRVKEEGWSYLLFTLKDYNPILKNYSSQTHTLHFHQGGCQAFLDTLRRHAALIPAMADEGLLLVSPHRAALAPGSENFLDHGSFGLLQRFKEDPVTATMGGLSKVTNYFFEAFKAPELHERPAAETFQGPDEELQQRPAGRPYQGLDVELRQGPAGQPFQGPEAELRQGPVRGVSDPLCEALDFNQQEESGFEVITRVALGLRPLVQRRGPVTEDEWSSYVDDQGRLTNVPQLKRCIFRGGLSPGVRPEGWRFLLGFFPWESSLEERSQLTRRRTDEYFRMKLQWKSVGEEQERHNSRLKENRSQIEKDVNRTDRTHWFYDGREENPGLILLHDILMTYCMYDFDLGYVQGMSDLLSPVLYVLESEVEAFWCFSASMEQLHQNFEEQMHGMKNQLIQLGTLLRLLEPTFWDYLETGDSGYLYFCFRWLLIRFKREFQFPDVLRLWEVMWTGLPCQNFHLLICCAILDAEKHTIMDQQYGFNDILKHINDLSMKLDLEAVLLQAEGLYLQLRACEDLPIAVVEILGLDPEPEPPEPSQPQPAGPGQSEEPEPPQSQTEPERSVSPEAPAALDPQDPDADPLPGADGRLRGAGPDVYRLAYIS